MSVFSSGRGEGIWRKEALIMARRMMYPLYQLGNPQLRVFRTDYFVKVVKPGVPLPEDTVQFRIPMEMTKVELKDYLESIYNVPVASVRTRIQHGAMSKRDHKNRRIKNPDYKVAYVQLMHWGSASGKFTPDDQRSRILGVEIKNLLEDKIGGAVGAAGQTFQFPELFPETEKSVEPDSVEEVQQKLLERNKEKLKEDIRRPGIPSFFGL